MTEELSIELLWIRNRRALDITMAADPDIVRRYAAMTTPAPPIQVTRWDSRLADGHHRVCAARLRGDKTIMAEVAG